MPNGFESSFDIFIAGFEPTSMFPLRFWQLYNGKVNLLKNPNQRFWQALQWQS